MVVQQYIVQLSSMSDSTLNEDLLRVGFDINSQHQSVWISLLSANPRETSGKDFKQCSRIFNVQLGRVGARDEYNGLTIYFSEQTISADNYPTIFVPNGDYCYKDSLKVVRIM